MKKDIFNIHGCDSCGGSGVVMEDDQIDDSDGMPTDCQECDGSGDSK